MRILLVGASGVVGRAFLPHAGAHTVLGLTRSADKVEALRALGVAAKVCDVYEPGALERIAVEFRPDLVVNFLTDLAGGPGPRNTRIRAEGGPIVLAAARAAGARALAVESVAFDLPGAAGEAVAALEKAARASGLAATVLRFARLWGPGTWDASGGGAGWVHIADAGRLAAEILFAAEPGTYLIEGTAARPIV